MQSAGWNLGGSSVAPLISTRHQQESPEFDITAMIDLVFMMNIYFLVTFLTAALGEVDLPSATHVAPLDADTAVILTVMEDLNDESVTVYLGDGEQGEPLHEDKEQERLVREIVEQGVTDGKTAVLIKAERHVCLRHLFRIVSAAAVEGMKLHVAVMEMEGSS